MRMWERVPRFGVGVFSASVVLHLVAYAQFNLILQTSQPIDEGFQLIPFLFAASLLLAAAMFAVRTALYFRFLLAVRFAVFLFVADLVDHHLFIELLLLLALLFEASIYEDYPLNLAICAVIAASSLLFRMTGSSGRPWSALLSDPGAQFYLVCSLLFSLTAGLVTRYRESMISYEDDVIRSDAAILQLTQANVDYQDMARTASERSAREERQRITRELHDTIVYTLTNISIMMEAAKDLTDKDVNKLIKTLDEASEQAKTGLSEIRTALYRLRQQQIHPERGITALVRMIRLFERVTGIRVRLEFGNVPASCGDAVDSALYHLVQEGLINSFRHGKATAVRLLLWRTEEGLIQVSLSDNGRAAGTVKEGIGISGMRERLGKLGGTLRVEGLPHGFQIIAEIPTED